MPRRKGCRNGRRRVAFLKCKTASPTYGILYFFNELKFRSGLKDIIGQILTNYRAEAIKFLKGPLSHFSGTIPKCLFKCLSAPIFAQHPRAKKKKKSRVATKTKAE